MTTKLIYEEYVMGNESKSDRPTDPPYGGGEDEGPNPREGPHELGEDVKEPPLPGSERVGEKFPRKGALPRD
jgi:hypothetical protein